MQLNEVQRKAVQYVEGPLLVIAGAGSGKTRVIIEKINYLITQCKMPANTIAAVTFTAKAAHEMKDRLSKRLPKASYKGLRISTFHGLGLKILQKEYQSVGLKKGFSILDEGDIRVLLNDTMRQHHEDDQIDLEEVITYISHWKNQLVQPEQAIEQSIDSKAMLSAKIYQRYHKILRTYNAVDFDDLIVLPVHLLNQDAVCLKKWQLLIRYLLVDEYQDTNAAQYALIKLLVGFYERFTLVGDDDQSIYAWRGARVENMVEVQDHYPNLTIMKLEQNYRSSSRILRIANQLISHNKNHFKKKLWSDLDSGRPVRVITCESEDSEAERIVLEIITHQLRYKTEYGDYAILYRSNYQSRALEIKLKEHQIPYYLASGVAFFSRIEVKDILAYCRLLINPDDDHAFLRIINVPKREIGLTTLGILTDYSAERNISLSQACEEFGLVSRLAPSALNRLKQFVQWIERQRMSCYEENPVKILHRILDTITYEKWLVDTSKTIEASKRRMSHVHMLLSMIERQVGYCDESLTGIEQLTQTIAKLMLHELLNQQEDTCKDQQVQLLTLHAAKGLEFPYVFMAGLEEDILPHKNSDTALGLEEERRLAYVGITRAKKELTFTLSSKRKRYGELLPTTPSPFLEELPQADLIYENRQNHAEKEDNNVVQGRDILSCLLMDLDT